MIRYARQVQLPEIGPAGQHRIERASVLVVGAGGLGAPVLSYLAGAGVGQLTIVDPDTVALSNLHRQVLFCEEDIGQAKAEAAATALKRLNADIEVRALATALDPANAPDLVGKADLVVDAADNFAVSYTLSDQCLAQNRPLVSASAIRREGYAGAFCGGAPSLRAIFPDPPQSSLDCARAGVLGPVVGMVGSMQAHMALAILTGLTPSPLGRLFRLSADNWHFSSFDFSRALEPDRGFPFVAKASVSPKDCLIDLRATDEAPQLFCENALRLEPAQLARFSGNRDKRVVLCCRSGLRAWRGAEILFARGYRNLALLALGEPV